MLLFDGWRLWLIRLVHGVSFLFPFQGVELIVVSWAHEICTSDNEERAIVIASMNEMAYVLQAWLPLIVWKQVEAPEYRKGFITITFLSFLLIVTTFVLRSLHHKQIRK